MSAVQYILMLYQDEAGFWFKLTEPSAHLPLGVGPQRPIQEESEQKQAIAAYAAYTDALEKAGVVKGMNRFQPFYSATTVRITDGKTEVLKGPLGRTGLSL